jgi:hypothetical protein
MSRGAIPAERIERSILVLRGHKVLLDADLAQLYGVETKVLLQALKRNPDCFPKDFMFQLTGQECRDLRSQFVISSLDGRLTCSPRREWRRAPVSRSGGI